MTRRATWGKHTGKSERDRVLEEYAAHCASGKDPVDFTFSYEVYSNADVKLALHQLFGGKCAYCESRYSGTQPMDVEHWRPKGEVLEYDATGVKTRLQGYHWLASTWSNLLPSCIDCNRPRTQTDGVSQAVELQGKGSQFPVRDGVRMKPPTSEVPDPAEDDALILDPTRDDPAAHLTFRSDGTVHPTAGSEKGRESIRVYALNRSELAFERLGVARLIEQRLVTITGLADLIAAGGLADHIELTLRDLVAHEINALYELAEPDQPYSEMARQMIAQNAPDGI
ncbi:hypothetical protein [Nocardioides sp. LML1-1-1.1]|uniref:hypothetical protein n=1 Tax=Nocardioides sp. LML1-1-1.1 TaxID=3135248 RepID=UPI0034150EBA